MKRKVLGIIVTLSMVLPMLPAMTLTAAAADEAYTQNASDGTASAWKSYTISNAQQLVWLAAAVNNGRDYQYSTFKLTANINDGTLEQIGYFDNYTQFRAFNGTFTGNGYKISNCTYGTGRALFGYVGRDGKIQNLNVSGSVTGAMEGYWDIGGIVGANEGEVTGCSFSGTASGSTSNQIFAGIGGVVGWNMEGGRVESCSNGSTVTGTGQNVYVGGVVGRNEGTVSNCHNTGKVSGTTTEKAFIGGVAGENLGTVSGCDNANEVHGTNTNGNGSIEIGGVVGYNHEMVSNCHNTGAVSGTGAGGSSFGGVVGYNYFDESSASNCYNTGKVSGTGGDDSCFGGVVGHNYYGGVTSSCYNTGEVSGSGGTRSCFGGVVGYNYNNSEVSNCYNTGKVSGTAGDGSAYAGGVVARSIISSKVSSCYNIGQVSGTVGTWEATLGGAVGENSGTVSNCYYGGSCTIGDSSGGVKVDDFGTGEVTWLMQNGQATQVWGQLLTGAKDNYPLLTGVNNSKKVLKVTFKTSNNENFAARYTNYNGTVTPPQTPNTNGKWYTENGTEFTASTRVTEDMAVTTARRILFDGEGGTITTTYGTGTTKNLDEYMSYQNNEATVNNKFTYNITNNGGITNASISGSTLTIPANVNAGTYTLRVTAKEKEPQFVTYALSYGTSDVSLTVTVKVDKADQSALSITNTRSSVTYGDTFTLGTSGGSGSGSVTWSVSPAGYAMVSSSGVVQATAATTGSVTITATKAADSNYNVKTATWSFTISKAAQAAPNAGDIKVSKSSSSITVTSPAGLSPVGTEHQYFVGATVPGETQWSGNPSFTGLESGKEYTVYVRYKENTNYFASGHASTTITTLSADGSATLQPGESVKTKNGTVTNNGDHITIEDEEGNITTVTPPAGDNFNGGVDVDSNGNVTIPEGSTVHPGNGGPDITVNDEATVDTDGNVTFPGGGSAEIGDTTVTVPKGGTLEPNEDGTVHVPKGGAVQTGDGPEMTLPEGGIVDVDRDGTVTADEIVVGGTTVKGDDVTADPDGTVHVPEGGVVTPPGGPDITLPEGGTVDPDGNIIPEGGSAKVGNTTVTVPESGTTGPDGEDNEEAPGGGTLQPDGKGGVEVPGGSAVTPPGGPNITVGPDNGGTVDKDGNVTLPGGGSAKVGDSTVTVPEAGGTLTPNGDGSVNVPPGSKVTDKDGKEHTVPAQGGRINSDGTYADNPSPSSGGGGGGANFFPFPPVIPKPEGGKVSVSPINPRWGNTVTITPTPDEGYEVGEVSVKDSRGNALKVKDNGNGTFSFTQPIGNVTIEVTFVTTSVPPVDDQDFPALVFSDLEPDVWYWEAVNYVVRNGLMNGYGDGIFGPNDTLSRAMLAQILYNQAGGVPVNYLMQYDDVSIDEWYTEAVRWVASENIVSGYGNSQFGPNDPITREQLAAMLYRFEQSQGGGFTGDWVFQPDYTDAEGISEYAREAIAWCVMNGIFSGYEDSTLRPTGQATRAEAAVMLMQFLSCLEEK